MAETSKGKNDKKHSDLEQNKKAEPISQLAKVVIIGFFGGVFWSFIGYIAYIFHFTELGPSLILQPWALGEWKNETIGQWIGIFTIGILSIGVAFVYYIFLKNILKIWPSILFGIGLWCIVFFILNPMFPDLESVREFSRDTIITTICLYILYALFVGYSISYDAKQLKEG